MKIGIDISQLAYPGSGVASYTYNLVDNLLKHDKENEFCLFFSSLRKKPQVDWQVKKFPFPPILLEFLWNQFHQIPIEKFVGQVDVFHTVFSSFTGGYGDRGSARSKGMRRRWSTA